MHIMWNIDKGMMLTASRRIDKSPTPRAEVFFFFPPQGPTRWQIPDTCHNYNKSYKINKRDGFHPQMTPFHFRKLVWGHFATNMFQINELKAEWHFHNLLELHYPASKGYIFAAWAGVRKASHDTAHKAKNVASARRTESHLQWLVL